MRYLDGSALNIRPCPPALHEDLRELAADVGQPFYLYVIGVLEAHVRDRHQPSTTRVVTSSAGGHARA